MAAAQRQSPAVALVSDVTPARGTLATIRIRRCAFRRLTALETGLGRTYDVECCLPGEMSSVPMGDMETATPICNTCVAPGRFRDDED
jgi:hypothetical protein